MTTMLPVKPCLIVCSPTRRLFVCGQPKTYAALCGAREETGLRKSSLLHELGHTGSMVVKM